MTDDAEREAALHEYILRGHVTQSTGKDFRAGYDAAMAKARERIEQLTSLANSQEFRAEKAEARGWTMAKVDWSKQHCGVHQAPFDQVIALMPDLIPVLQTFPDFHKEFTWDVKVHMLMPRQYPCIPGWHVDNVPRDDDGRQMFNKIRLDLPMYMWISGGPLTQFREGYIKPEKWVKFYQNSEHRGQAASEFTWRGFIRATHRDIMPPKSGDWQRRHCQVYVDEVDYQW